MPNICHPRTHALQTASKVVVMNLTSASPREEINNLKLLNCCIGQMMYLSIRRHMGRNHSVCRRVVLLSRDSFFETIHDVALQYILNSLVKFLNQDNKVSHSGLFSVKNLRNRSDFPEEPHLLSLISDNTQIQLSY